MKWFVSPRVVRFVLEGTAILSFIGAPANLSAATGPLLGQLWDVELSVPAGAYRATKTIGVEGDATQKIEPGAFLDSVKFATRGGIQHWKIEGAFLRKVSITGKRGSSIRGKDSVFEEFFFHKDDYYFDQWWSTRSKFTNCIFTKRFLRGDLPPLDYAAYAERCTFYGVSLPPIGMKEDPAGYLQKENMSFVRCRFVQCEVPESFLAATVDCVFENCRFQGKRHDWPKNSGPIKVNAYFESQGSAPKSFINGPLTVQFVEAPKTVQFGSDLPHRQSAGRVTLQNIKDLGQYTMLGSVSKAASEIPPTGDTTSALPSTPVPPSSNSVPAPFPAKTAGPLAAVDVNNLAELLRPLPMGIELLSGGQLNVAGVEAANAWLDQMYSGKQASMRVFIDEAKATKEEGFAFRVTSRPQTVISRGASIPAKVVALFKADAAAALGGTTKAREIAVHGVIKKAALVGSGRTLVLTVTLADTRLQ